MKQKEKEFGEKQKLGPNNFVFSPAVCGFWQTIKALVFLSPAHLHAFGLLTLSQCRLVDLKNFKPSSLIKVVHFHQNVQRRASVPLSAHTSGFYSNVVEQRLSARSKNNW